MVRERERETDRDKDRKRKKKRAFAKEMQSVFTIRDRTVAMNNRKSFGKHA